jgi:hypothetical protein
MTTRWIFDYGGVNQYNFPRNPDRYGGDTYWQSELRLSELDIIGANSPTIQVDGFRGSRRTIRFTAITGVMMRELEKFYYRRVTIANCRDHLYSTTLSFSCFVIAFSPSVRPTIGNFPGSSEDTWDLEMTVVRMN